MVSDIGHLGDGYTYIVQSNIHTLGTDIPDLLCYFGIRKATQSSKPFTVGSSVPAVKVLSAESLHLGRETFYMLPSLTLEVNQ